MTDVCVILARSCHGLFGLNHKFKQQKPLMLMLEQRLFAITIGVLAQVGRFHTYVHADSIGTDVVFASKHCSNLQGIQKMSNTECEGYRERMYAPDSRCMW